MLGGSPGPNAIEQVRAQLKVKARLRSLHIESISVINVKFKHCNVKSLSLVNRVVKLVVTIDVGKLLLEGLVATLEAPRPAGVLSVKLALVEG